MLDESGGERLRLEHPLWDQSLLATFSRDSIVTNSADPFRSQDQYSLIIERMVGIADDKRLSVVMGSMPITRLFPRLCAEISGPLHASRRHLEPAIGRAAKWPSEFSLQGLFRRPAKQGLAPLK